MACTNKTDLILLAQKEFEKLSKLITPLEQTQVTRIVDGTTIKDVIGHRAHWIGLYLGWYADGMAGKPVYFPAEGYKWNDLKRYNADLRAKQADLDWHGACTLLRARHASLIEFLSAKTDVDLYGGPMKGANNTWTPGRWAEAAGPSHYRSAAKFVRLVLRST